LRKLPGVFSNPFRQKQLAIGINQNYSNTLSETILINHLTLTRKP
jgi:hypothetical protein